MQAERGYVEIRLLVVLALVAALVWVLPSVLLGGRGSRAGSPLAVTGAPAGGTAPGEVTLPDVAASPATGPVATGAGATGPGVTGPGATGPAVTGPAATGGGAVLDPVAQSHEVEAQSTLNDAVRVAQVFYAENGSFQAFGPDVAVEYDPAIVYSQGSPIPNMVVMTVTPTSVVLVTMVDGSGAYLCAALEQDAVSFGRANATIPSQCQGGW